MEDQHIANVTGLPDIATFMAILQRKQVRHGDIHAVLVGGSLALPEELRSTFFQIGARAFPECHLHLCPLDSMDTRTTNWSGVELSFLPPADGKRILYVNHVHLPEFAAFAAALKPDQCEYFDQGLVSYGKAGPQTRTMANTFGLPPFAHAWLTLSPPFDVPDHLHDVPVERLDHDDFLRAHARLRSAGSGVSPEYRLPSAVLVGTQFWKGERISFARERRIFLEAIKRLRAEGHQTIAYKSHPRSTFAPCSVPKTV